MRAVREALRDWMRGPGSGESKACSVDMESDKMEMLPRDFPQEERKSAAVFLARTSALKLEQSFPPGIVILLHSPSINLT